MTGATVAKFLRTYCRTLKSFDESIYAEIRVELVFLHDHADVLHPAEQWNWGLEYHTLILFS